jgi:hypothetical protein
LKEILGLVRRALKERRFSSRGLTFFRKADRCENTLLISIQRSVKSTSTDSLVTINYGVRSRCIERRLKQRTTGAVDVSTAHWRKRLSEGGREKWLHLRMLDSVEDNAATILRSVEGVLEELEEHSTDEALRDEWLTASSPGIGRMQRLLYLAVLLDEIGPADKLPAVLSEVRHLVAGSVHEGEVERQLADAGLGAP